MDAIIHYSERLPEGYSLLTRILMDSYGHFVAEFLLLNLFFAEIVTLPGGALQISRDNLSKKIDSFVFIL